MHGNSRRTALLILSLTGAVILLISASLSGMEFKQGTPFPGQSQPVHIPSQGQDTAPLLIQSPPLVLSTVLVAAVGGYLSFLIIRHISRQPRKISFRLTFLFPILVAAALLVLLLMFARQLPASSGSGGIPSSSGETYATAPIGKPPAGFIWGTGVVLVLIAGLVMLQILRRKPAPGPAADPIIKEAENALTALKQGGNLRDVILDCYIRMSRTLAEERGLERGKSMTAHEFETLLVARGIPASPVSELTGLFEAVRYGGLHPSTDDEKKGIDSLNAIIHSVRRDQEGS